MVEMDPLKSFQSTFTVKWKALVCDQWVMLLGLMCVHRDVVLKSTVYCGFDFGVSVCLIWAGSQRICVDIYLWRICWASEPWYRINPRDLSQRNIDRTNNNQQGWSFPLLQGVLVVSKSSIMWLSSLLTTPSSIYHSLTSFLCGTMLWLIVFMLSQLCDWWIERQVCRSVDTRRAHYAWHTTWAVQVVMH